MGQITFQKEPFDDFIVDALPLLVKHWREIATYQDIPLAIDEDRYRSMEKTGNLVIYTARDDGKLIAYSAFFIGQNGHYSTSGPQAVQDVIYLSPEYRGGRLGLTFIKNCDSALTDAGIQVVSQHEKIAHPALGRILGHLGYKPVERIWVKRLDGKG